MSVSRPHTVASQTANIHKDDSSHGTFHPNAIAHTRAPTRAMDLDMPNATYHSTHRFGCAKRHVSTTVLRRGFNALKSLSACSSICPSRNARIILCPHRPLLWNIMGCKCVCDSRTVPRAQQYCLVGLPSLFAHCWTRQLPSSSACHQ